MVLKEFVGEVLCKELKKCDICGNTPRDVYAVNSSFEFTKCSCGLVYVNPQPTQEYINFFYNNGNYSVEGWEKIPHYIKRVEIGHKKIVDYLLKEINKGSLLDIGAGLVDQYDYLKQNGWSVVGTELSKTFVDVYKNKGYDIMLGDMLKMGFKDSSFDVIIMNAVLEHLSNPRDYLEHCFKLLKPNGIIIITIPNLDYFLMQSTNLSLDDQLHLYHFNKKTITKLLQSCGFDVVNVLSVLECGSENWFKDKIMVVWSWCAAFLWFLSFFRINSDLQLVVEARKK